MTANRPPRVLQVIDSLWPGGAERLMPVLVGELARSGDATPLVLVNGTGDSADKELERSVREASESFAYTGTDRVYNPLLVRTIGRVARRRRIDVIHSHLNVANVASRAAATMLGIPHVTTVHSPPGEHSEDGRRRLLADGLTARLSTRIVGVSPDTAEIYGKRFRVPERRLRVIPNGTPPRPTSPGFDRDAMRRELLGPDAGAPVVLCAARLEERKGVADLIAAAPALRDRVPGLKVLVAGKGADEERLRGMVQSSGLQDTVVMLGYRDDIGDLLAAADVLCLPSYNEGLPVSLLEAMHAELPCVATRVGGTPFVIRDGETGLLVDPGHPEQLVQALARVLLDASFARRLSEQAGEQVRRSFTPETMAGAYAALYREVIAVGRRA